MITKNNFIDFVVNTYFARIKIMPDPKIEEVHNGLKLMLLNSKNLDSSTKIEFAEILNKIYELTKDSDMQEKIKKSEIKRSDLMNEFVEKNIKDIAGKNITEEIKRDYNMSCLFNEDLIRKKSENDRDVRFLPKAGQEHKYYNNEGKKVIIQEVGKIYYTNWNGLQDDLSEYRVYTQLDENTTLMRIIFSDINISEMENVKYRDAVLNGLLSKDNIENYNVCGYIGEISKKDSSKVKEDKPTDYYYPINDKYDLKYAGADLTAVMIYAENKRKEQEKIEKATEGEER